MKAKSDSVAMRAGHCLGRVVRKLVDVEARLVGWVRPPVAGLIKTALRIAVAATLLYFVLVPGLMLLLAVAVIVKLGDRSRESTGDLYGESGDVHPIVGTRYGHEGYGLYRQDIRMPD